jgi:hypothetical protein
LFFFLLLKTLGNIGIFQLPILKFSTQMLRVLKSGL